MVEDAHNDAAQVGNAQTSNIVALVNGEPMPVELLTHYIDGIRSHIGSQTDAAWEAYLKDQGHTPDTYWAFLIDHYGREMVVTQQCQKLGITVSASDIDDRIAQLKKSVGAIDDKTAFLWDAYLARRGGERALRADLAYYLAREKLFKQQLGTFAQSLGMESVPEQGSAQWRELCGRYAAALYNASTVKVLIKHQYDVPGQRHGGPERVQSADKTSSKARLS